MSKKIGLGQDVEVTSSSPNDNRLEKKWGYVTAYPHEYLIHFRKGQFNQRNSGQGASCFKWATDTVFIIPTSLKEIVFEANQLSADNVDLRLRGMAVYRINNPQQIYTMLNFSNRQQAEEKLARMIGDLCRSTSKWLVANMNVEECMRKRKEDIAGSLKQEVSVVVADDEKGWGVEIVTIDIQDVYIQDNEIFNAMQTQFKSEKMRESEMVRLEAERNLEIKRLDTERNLAEHRKDNELERVRIDAELKEEQLKLSRRNEEKQFDLKKYRLEEEDKLARYQQEQTVAKDKQGKLLQIEMERTVAVQANTKNIEQIQMDAQIRDKTVLLSKQNEEHQFALDQYRVQQNEDIVRYKLEQEIAREQRKIQLKQESLQQEIELRRLSHLEEIETLNKRIEVENQASPVSLEKNFIEKALPAIAETLAKSMNNSRLNIIQESGKNGGGGTPFKFILMEIMDILRERMERLDTTKDQPTQTMPEDSL